MREIKFRYVFKHKEFKDVSFYYFTLKEIEEGAIETVLSSGMLENGYELIARDTYIGLKDKNGTEIYEVDKVRYCDDIGQIIWNNKDACFEVQGKDWNTNCFNSKEIEIISSIYENPEFLK